MCQLNQEFEKTSQQLTLIGRSRFFQKRSNIGYSEETHEVGTARGKDFSETEFLSLSVLPPTAGLGMVRQGRSAFSFRNMRPDKTHEGQSERSRRSQRDASPKDSFGEADDFVAGFVRSNLTIWTRSRDTSCHGNARPPRPKSRSELSSERGSPSHPCGWTGHGALPPKVRRTPS
jgi:hypothetical protein